MRGGLARTSRPPEGAQDSPPVNASRHSSAADTGETYERNGRWWSGLVRGVARTLLGRGGRGGRAHLIQLAREDHHRDRDRGQVLCREGRVREPVSEVTQIMAGVTSSICKEARTGNGGGEGEEGESVVLRDAEWLGVASARGMWGGGGTGRTPLLERAREDSLALLVPFGSGKIVVICVRVGVNWVNKLRQGGRRGQASGRS